MAVGNGYASGNENDLKGAVFICFQNIRINKIAVNSNAIKEKALNICQVPKIKKKFWL